MVTAVPVPSPAGDAEADFGAALAVRDAEGLQLEAFLHSLSDAEAALAKVKDAATEELLRVQGKADEAQQLVKELQDTQVELEARIARLEEKLVKKREDNKRLYFGIEEVVEKYEVKLERKNRDTQDLHATISQLTATIEELEAGQSPGKGDHKPSVKRASLVSPGRDGSPSRAALEPTKVKGERSQSCSSQPRSPRRQTSSRSPLARRAATRSTPEGGGTGQGTAAASGVRSPSAARDPRDRSCQGSPRRSRERSRSAARSDREKDRERDREKDRSTGAKRDTSPRDSPSQRPPLWRRQRSRSASRDDGWREGARNGGSGAQHPSRERRPSRPRSRSRGEPWRPRYSSGFSKNQNRGGGAGAGAGAGGGAQGGGVCIPYINGKCRKGDKCSDYHPPEDSHRQILDKFKCKPCRFGKDCKRSDCVFQHPGDSKGGRR